MNQTLSTAEQRLLWMLVAHPEGEFESVQKPANAKPTREALARAGLIEVEKRVKRSKSNRRTSATHLRLTDAGWAWCNRNMSWTKPRGKGEQFLDSLLKRLKILFERPGTASSLADFINQSTPDDATLTSDKAATTVDPRDGTLGERIRAACLELGGGREAVRIRIADLRKRLADVSKDDLTEKLLELSRRRELTLDPFDDPRQITPDDAAAAIYTSTGVPLHILYYGGIVS